LFVSILRGTGSSPHLCSNGVVLRPNTTNSFFKASDDPSSIW
jgi:hypothetical protein